MPKGVPNKRYTGEFKQMVVETMMKDKPSCRETAQQFEIPCHKRVAEWERIYLSEGAGGFFRIIPPFYTTSYTDSPHDPVP